MNREIKFRAWIADDNTMFYQNNQYLQSFLRRANEFHQRESNGHDSYGTPPLMQYTGLKDKNGVEIYEGDLLQFVGCFFEVCFDRGAFYGKPLSANDIRGVLSCQSFPDARIIGNVYENPKL